MNVFLLKIRRSFCLVDLDDYSHIEADCFVINKHFIWLRKQFQGKRATFIYKLMSKTRYIYE